jgi:hypothetical protein
MNAATHALRIDVDQVPDDSLGSRPLRRSARDHEPYTTRSIRNITLWRAYLPEDCVKAMIKMGWDRST